MRELLGAIGDTWAAAGHQNLRTLVANIEVPEAVKTGSGVPQHLMADYSTALAGLGINQQLRGVLEGLGSSLLWSEGSMTMPESFRGRYSYVELAGPKGMITSDVVSFGLYLQKSGTVYPSHWHEAVEHYLVLSGTADWQMDDAPYVKRVPGEAFVHASNQPHATTTFEEPLLALWFWQGNISDSTYRIAGVEP
jgi:mannose-6-phosphate isomerase-like protein (cupin superfamily)